MRVIKTAVRAPDMNAVMERLLRSLRAEALDHLLIMDERHLDWVVRSYSNFFNRSRPHQGIAQRVPAGSVTPIRQTGKIVRSPVLGGLHHDYRRAA